MTGHAEALVDVARQLEKAAAAQSWSRYPDYRDSGSSLLGQLPTHWQVRRLKYIAQIQFSNVDKKTEDDEHPVRLCNYVDVYYNDRITGDIEFMEATALRREMAKFQLVVGDVLVTKDSEDPNDICVPAVVAEDLPGVLCGYHLAQIRPNSEDTTGPYLCYAFGASGIRDQFRQRANGITRFGLSQDAICTALFPVPPISEQKAISAFLDRKTVQIDRLVSGISASEESTGLMARQSRLLLEYRQALISAAVTGKIDVRKATAGQELSDG